MNLRPGLCPWGTLYSAPRPSSWINSIQGKGATLQWKGKGGKSEVRKGKKWNRGGRGLIRKGGKRGRDLPAHFLGVSADYGSACLLDIKLI